MVTALPARWLPLALFTVLAVSPLLAGWTAALASGVTSSWWRPRRVTLTRWAIVAAVVTTLTAAGAVTNTLMPWPAWLVFAAGGGVLAVLDAETHRLPARLVRPLAVGEATVLTVAAVVDGDSSRLLRAACAAAVVGGVWLGVVFLAPPAMGLGDVRLLAVTAGLLGWISWPAVLAGQLITFLFAGITAAVPAARRSSSFRHLQVPIGPAVVVGALITCSLF